jgi:mono/diheme cytochrome c family protein/glucose/arabinose dehydrogenase
MRTPSPPIWATILVMSLAALGIGRCWCAPEPPAVSIDKEIDESTLRPGLLAVYQTLTSDDRGTQLTRIDAKPAFAWGNDSPHPRLPPGPFAVTWTGFLIVHETDTIRFSAWLGGEATVTVGKTRVFQGRGRPGTGWQPAATTMECKPGVYPLRIDYQSLPGVPAQVQFRWQGRTFAQEPLPAVRLKYLPDELAASAREDEIRERGRAAVARLGCAACHAEAFPGVAASPPGPSLADVGQRVNRSWLLDWLADPAKIRPGSRMPVLFAPDRQGFVERWLIAEYLRQATVAGKPSRTAGTGDHRQGREAFLGLGCAACHYLPDKDNSDTHDSERFEIRILNDRFTPAHLAAFLLDPSGRYPDKRMPRFPIAREQAANLTAFLQMWSTPATAEEPINHPATNAEVLAVAHRLGVSGADAGPSLLQAKGCVRCHPGLGAVTSASVPIRNSQRGCLSGRSGPRFTLDRATCHAIEAFLTRSGAEKPPSLFVRRQQRLHQAGCFRCHQRDGEGDAPIEAIGRTVWSSHLMRLPYQRTPPLTQALAKYTPAYLLATVRDGVMGVRPSWYSYRMPVYGAEAGELVRALAEADGEMVGATEPPFAAADPTLYTVGLGLAGFDAYSCMSCHVWKGSAPGDVEPGTVGPELTTVTQRIRRSWFERWLDDPRRIHPGTPMPAIFHRGEPASIRNILNGDAGQQKEALWAYLSQGKKAPTPPPRSAIPIALHAPGGPPLVGQIPIQPPQGPVLESLCISFGNQEVALYDLADVTLRNLFTGAQILRRSSGWRSYALEGKPLVPGALVEGPIRLVGSAAPERPSAVHFLAYERHDGNVQLRFRCRFAAATVDMMETLAMVQQDGSRWLRRQLVGAGVPAGSALEVRLGSQHSWSIPKAGPEVKSSQENDGLLVRFRPAADGKESRLTLLLALPPSAAAPQIPVAVKKPLVPLAGGEGEIDPAPRRPGYRAIVYPRPKTPSGEDRVMPGALAVDPLTGRLFIASMKLGEIFRLDDPHDNGTDARVVDYAHGLFQDAYAMLHDGRALYVLHRRNLTRIAGDPQEQTASRFDRVAALPHAIADNYDWGYGLTQDREGRFLMTFAPHANQKLPGSGAVLRVTPSKAGAAFEELAFGLRNPFGWCSGPSGDVFFTDNQGEWVATNKICHMEEGRFYGYPNPGQPQHIHKSFGKTAVWVPYDWARSLNGLAYESTGKFGPFAGQFFLAELMHGGGIIRVSLEQVNGVYQGACFPFWGKGLLGPLVLAFDPKGRLYVGSITQPGWMGQPDRGALFRIDFTGEIPFEIQTIHAKPDGFQLVLTRPVDPRTACDFVSYGIEHYRYEYTGAYGSPELERSRLNIRQVELQPDGRTVNLTTAPLVKDRVYAISAAGLRSLRGEKPVHVTGVYTLNEIPTKRR